MWCFWINFLYCLLTYLQLLRPRKDVGKFEKKPKKKKSSSEKSEKSEKLHHDKSNKTSKPDLKSNTTQKESKVSHKENGKISTTKDGASKSSSSKDNKNKIKEEPLGSPPPRSSVTEDDKTSNEDEKKPIGLLVEALNMEDYQAPDPLTVAQGLKQDEGVELSAIRELRQKNLQKLAEENLEGPFCVCRKGIDGFMIRCNLCFNWYHTSCICPPKTVHGKPIGKGYNAWSATREVHYLCTHCCRSRRPRLDNILQLLMSLQKLPVRVPEGEALQFLTERAMNWQDRAKQALADPEIHRIVSEARSQAEKLLAEKQAAVSANSNHNGTQLNILFYQKLLSVKKLNKEKSIMEFIEHSVKEQSSNQQSDNDNKPVAIISTPILTPVALTPVVPMETTTTTSTSNTSTTDEATKIEPSSSTTILRITSEDSSLSTTTTMTTTTTTLVHKPPAESAEADLECTEEMSSGSPVSAKPPSVSTTDPNVVRIQSASSSRAHSPIDVCTPLDNLSIPKPASQITLTPDVLTMGELSLTLLDQLEDLVFEGELLEVGLDEVQQLWAILQIQRPMSKEACNIMVSVNLSVENRKKCHRPS